MNFKPGDRVRCIDASLSSHRLTCGKEYKVLGIEGDYYVNIHGTVGSWETDRFEKVNAQPESVTNAPDAAAAGVYERVLLIAKIYAKANAESWAKAVEQLEAIK